MNNRWTRIRIARDRSLFCMVVPLGVGAQAPHRREPLTLAPRRGARARARPRACGGARGARGGSGIGGARPRRLQSFGVLLDDAGIHLRPADPHRGTRPVRLRGRHPEAHLRSGAALGRAPRGGFGLGARCVARPLVPRDHGSHGLRLRPFVSRRGDGRGGAAAARGRRGHRAPRDRPLRGGPADGARSRERDAPGRARPAEASERRVGPGPRRARVEAPDRLAGERAAAPRGRSRSRSCPSSPPRENLEIGARGGPRARVARAGGHASREVRGHRIETLDADGRRFGRLPAAREVQQLRRLLPDLHARLRGGRCLHRRPDLDRRPLRGRTTGGPGPLRSRRGGPPHAREATSRWPSGGPRPPSQDRWPSGASPAGRGESPTAGKAPRSCSSARDGASSSSSTSGRWPWPTPTTRPLRRAWRRCSNGCICFHCEASWGRRCWAPSRPVPCPERGAELLAALRQDFQRESAGRLGKELPAARQERIGALTDESAASFEEAARDPRSALGREGLDLAAQHR